MVEGARQESVYTGNCIKGSNPLLSAKIHCTLSDGNSIAHIYIALLNFRGIENQGRMLILPMLNAQMSNPSST